MIRAIKSRSSAGFTIVELTIATLIFSIILIVIVSGVLSFTKSYYRGVNVSATQNATRNIVDTVSQAIQFSSGKAVVTGLSGPNGTQYFCAGGYSFVYKTGQQFKPTDGFSIGMYSRAITTSDCPSPTSGTVVPADAKQLLGIGMRVTTFGISKSPDGKTYTINLRIANGDDDLLTATTGNNVQCKSQTGSQFCAVSGIQSAVQGRVE